MILPPEAAPLLAVVAPHLTHPTHARLATPAAAARRTGREGSDGDRFGRVAASGCRAIARAYVCSREHAPAGRAVETQRQHGRD